MIALSMTLFLSSSVSDIHIVPLSFYTSLAIATSNVADVRPVLDYYRSIGASNVVEAFKSKSLLVHWFWYYH